MFPGSPERVAALCCAVVCCAAVRCAVLRSVVPRWLCCAVLCGGSVAPPGPAWGAGGAGQTGGFAVWDAEAPCGFGLRGWLVAGVRGWAWSGLLGQCSRGSGRAVWSGASGGCPWGCPPSGLAPWSRALWWCLSPGVRWDPGGRVEGWKRVLRVYCVWSCVKRE